MKKTILFFVAGLLMQTASAALVWNGKAEQWTSGDGTLSKPYLLEKPQHLAYLSQQVANGSETYEGKWFLQTEDFDMAGATGYMFTPIGTDESHPFKGSYDGSFRIISNLQITYANSIQNCALFGYAQGSDIQNIFLEDVTFAASGVTYMAALVAYLNGCTVWDCHYNGELTTSATYTGGLIAYATGASSILKCENNGTITSTVSHYSNKSYYLGGVCGYSDLTIIENTYNHATISHTHSYSSSNNTSYVGGVIGYGPVNATNIGNSADIIINNTTSNAHYFYVGGLNGCDSSSSSTYTKCYNKGNISSVNSKCGGWWGGLVGIGNSSDYPTFTQCFNTGNILHYSSSVGTACGLAHYGTFISCYAVCNLLGNGAYGIAELGTIKHCYYAGTMTANSSFKYAIANSATAENNYFLAGTYSNTSYGQSLSEALMKAVSFPMSLNHNEDDIYVMDENNINNGYPILAWQLIGVTKYTVTTSCDESMGSVSGAGTYDIGEVITVAATPKDGYAFVGWQDGVTTNPREVTVNDNKNFIATFVKMVYTIDINQDCTVTVE